ncbi:MAG TPA: hypothetical protein ENK15_01935 [Thermopetrobacter sp.]|nr:hypothetical protein [Thermopetrobacter sp.]
MIITRYTRGLLAGAMLLGMAGQALAGNSAPQLRLNSAGSMAVAITPTADLPPPPPPPSAGEITISGFVQSQADVQYDSDTASGLSMTNLEWGTTGHVNIDARHGPVKAHLGVRATFWAPGNATLVMRRAYFTWSPTDSFLIRVGHTDSIDTLMNVRSAFGNRVPYGPDTLDAQATRLVNQIMLQYGMGPVKVGVGVQQSTAGLITPDVAGFVRADFDRFSLMIGARGGFSPSLPGIVYGVAAGAKVNFGPAYIKVAGAYSRGLAQEFITSNPHAPGSLAPGMPGVHYGLEGDDTAWGVNGELGGKLGRLHVAVMGGYYNDMGTGANVNWGWNAGAQAVYGLTNALKIGVRGTYARDTHVTSGNVMTTIAGGLFLRATF